MLYLILLRWWYCGGISDLRWFKWFVTRFSRVVSLALGQPYMRNIIHFQTRANHKKAWTIAEFFIPFMIRYVTPSTRKILHKLESLHHLQTWSNSRKLYAVSIDIEFCEHVNDVQVNGYCVYFVFKHRNGVQPCETTIITLCNIWPTYMRIADVSIEWAGASIY